MKPIRVVSVLDSKGAEVWCGSMHDFGKTNGREVLGDVVEQFRNSREVHGNYEPAFIGGGAAEEFSVLLVDREELDAERRALLEEVQCDIEIARRRGTLPAESIAALERTASQLRAELAS